MGDKKKLSGWMRLWIVGSSLWTIYVTVGLEPWRIFDNPSFFSGSLALALRGYFLAWQGNRLDLPWL